MCQVRRLCVSANLFGRSGFFYMLEYMLGQNWLKVLVLVFSTGCEVAGCLSEVRVEE